MSKTLRVAMDIGGTFTDFVQFDAATGTYRTEKVSTTPGRLQVGVMEGLRRLVDDFRRIDFCVHGTTAGLNALLERRGARVALVTTEGFRDVYEIARGNRPEMYNVRYRKPAPLVKRRDVYEVPERIRFDGTVQKPLTREALQPLVAALRKGGYQSVAVCLLFAYVNPVHELLVKEVLGEELPGLSVSLSHEVAREWREYERTSTTVINAYVAPIVQQYLDRLEAEMQARGMEEPLYIMRSNGGVMTADIAKERPIQTLLSGPVGGAVGTAVLGRALGLQNLIGIDMGGTSFDVTMVVDGRVDVTNEANLEGFPILSPMVHIHTIGAGGGSVAWLQGGGLRVGPRSAGAQPGPACYGRGGTEATVTDANVTLGRVDPGHFLGGNMRLDKAAADAAVGRVAELLGIGLYQAAEGICDVVNAKMADAIRTITVRKGIDPREFTLVAFGGAGPMHAAFIARELNIRTVVVPRFPGAFSAWGMLQTDIRHDDVRTFVQPVVGVDAAAIEETYAVMEQAARTVLERQKVAPDNMLFIRAVDMRYVGQEYTVNVGLPGRATDPGTLAALAESFHQQHLNIYGHSSPKTPVETVNLRLVAIGRISAGMPQPEGAVTSDELHPRAVQPVVFGGIELSTAMYRRDDLRPGHRFSGPAVVEEFTATTVVPPDFAVSVDGFGNLVLTDEKED